MSSTLFVTGVALMRIEYLRAQKVKAYYVLNSGEKEMDNELISSLTGKKVVVKTLGDYAEGVAGGVKSGFLVIQSPKNDGKDTLINISTIETIKIKK